MTDATGKIIKEGMSEKWEFDFHYLVEQHRVWVLSDGKDGKQARVSDASLSGATLKGFMLDKADFSRADLTGTTFEECSLRRAKFSNAKCFRATFDKCDAGRSSFDEADISFAAFKAGNLRRANLTNTKANATKFVLGTQLREADFSLSDLHQAELAGSVGLAVQQLGGTDVSRATLPEEIGKFRAVEHAEDISKNARTIFLGVIGGCVFSWLTIATTTDVALLINSTSTPLPIIGTKVPIAYFFVAAPTILLALFIYLHLYLQRLWSALADLPAVFEDGRRIEERVYPWLLTTFATKHMPRLSGRPPVMLNLQVWISLCFAWLLVPVTCGLFWARFSWAFQVPGYHKIYPILISILLLVAFFAAYWFYRHAEVTFSLNSDQRNQRFQVDLRPSRKLQVAAIGLGIISFLIMRGNTPEHFVGTDLRGAELSNFDFAGFHFEEGDFSGVEANGASFKNAHLLGARFEGGKLQNTHFEGASARHVIFIAADLRKAKFRNAELHNAEFNAAILTEAIFNRADAPATFFANADLTKAHFASANLSGANFYGANLRGTKWLNAIINQVNFTGADLTGARGLTQDQLDQACAYPPGTPGNSDVQTKLPPGLTIKPCQQ